MVLRNLSLSQTTPLIRLLFPPGVEATVHRALAGHGCGIYRFSSEIKFCIILYFFIIGIHITAGIYINYTNLLKAAQWGALKLLKAAQWGPYKTQKAAQYGPIK